jgi:hypothetical protein
MGDLAIYQLTTDSLLLSIHLLVPTKDISKRLIIFRSGLVSSDV